MRLQYVHRPEVSEPEPDEPEDPPAPLTHAPSARPQNQETREPAPEPPPVFAPVTRVRQSLVTTADEQPVSRAELLKGYEVEPDRYVVLDPEELKGLRRKTSPTMEIVRSVLLSEIDPVFFETSYYLVPGRGGEKAYAILFAALRKTGHVALAKVGMYGREHVIVIRPGKFGMLAHTMFYTDEIRFENEFRTDVDSVGAKELELARMFLEALEAPFSPEEFKDVYREELQAMIAKKMAEANVSAAGPAPVAAPPPVVDILEALRKSIEMKRKPAQSETQSSPAEARKTPARGNGNKTDRQVRNAH